LAGEVARHAHAHGTDAAPAHLGMDVPGQRPQPVRHRTGLVLGQNVELPADAHPRQLRQAVERRGVNGHGAEQVRQEHGEAPVHDALGEVQHFIGQPGHLVHDQHGGAGALAVNGPLAAGVGEREAGVAGQLVHGSPVQDGADLGAAIHRAAAAVVPQHARRTGAWLIWHASWTIRTRPDRNCASKMVVTRFMNSPGSCKSNTRLCLANS